MADFDSYVDRARVGVHRAGREAVRGPWIERLARAGYAAKGVVYIVLGILAAQTALSSGSAKTDSRDALRAIADQPFGTALLAVVAVGLVGFVAWRFVQAAFDPERKGTSAKGIVARGANVVSGILYAALAFAAIRLLMGEGSGGGDSAKSWSAKLMEQPFGRWMLGLAGVAVIVAGLVQLYNAWSARFREKLELVAMSLKERVWATRAGRFGLAARGVVFGLMGAFLIQAALHANPREAEGLGGALQSIASQSHGPWLLAIVALGLAAYGVYCLFLARYRRILTR